MSKSYASTKVENIDKRAALGDDSVLVTSDNSTVNVEVLDGGAFDLAKTAVSSNNIATRDVLDFAKVIWGGAAGVVGQNTALSQAAVSSVKDAFQAEDSGLVDKNTLMLAAVVVAGVVVYMVMRRK